MAVDAGGEALVEVLDGGVLLRCIASSAAAANQAELARGLAALVATSRVALAVEDDGSTREPIVVTLIDADLTEALISWGQRPGEIVGPYSPEASWLPVGRSVVSAAAGISGDGAFPAAVADWIVAVSRGSDLAPVERRVLDGIETGQLPELTDLLQRDATSLTTVERSALMSFAGFVGTTRGGSVLREVTAASSHDPAATVTIEALLGSSLSDIEGEWIGALASSGVPSLGVRWFLRKVRPFLRPYRRQQAVVVVSTLLSTAFLLLLPLIFGLIVDRAIEPQDGNALGLILIALLVLFALEAAVSLGGQYAKARLGTSLLNDLRAAMFDRVHALPPRFHSDMSSGDLIARMGGDLPAVEGAVTNLIPAIVGMVLAFGGSLVVLIALDWQLTVAVLLTMPVLMLGPLVLGPRTAKAGYRQQVDEAAVLSNFQQSLAGHRVIRLFGLVPLSSWGFRRHLERLGTSSVRTSFYAASIGTTTQLGMSLALIVSFGVGGWLVIEGHMTVGVLVAFQGLIANVTTPLFSMSDLLQEIHRSSGSLQRVLEILERPLPADHGSQQPTDQVTDVRFEQVNFGYDESRLSLTGASFEVPHGELVALVGPSGSGKSTVLSLLLALERPTSGRILVGGVDLTELDTESYRANVAVVFQESFLFDDTVRENIRLGRLDATDDEIEQAASDAGLHDAVRELPDGYDTLVGEGGARLSGGQRQRVAIARALVRRPALLVFDEPTSSLDPRAEAAVTETIERLAGTRTVIMATHRLATVRRADRVIVLEAGRVVEVGSPDQLAAAGGVFAELSDRQRGGVSWSDRLAAVPLLAGLQREALEELAEAVVPMRWQSGEVIFREGEIADRLHVVSSGEVEAILEGPDRARRLRTLGAGEVFGEVAVFGSGVRSATVRAVDAAMTLTIDAEVARRVLGSDPVVGPRVELLAAARRAVTS